MRLCACGVGYFYYSCLLALLALSKLKVVSRKRWWEERKMKDDVLKKGMCNVLNRNS